MKQIEEKLRSFWGLPSIQNEIDYCGRESKFAIWLTVAFIVFVIGCSYRNGWI